MLIGYRMHGVPSGVGIFQTCTSNDLIRCVESTVALCLIGSYRPVDVELWRYVKRLWFLRPKSRSGHRFHRRLWSVCPTLPYPLPGSVQHENNPFRINRSPALYSLVFESNFSRLKIRFWLCVFVEWASRRCCEFSVLKNKKKIKPTCVYAH